MVTQGSDRTRSGGAINAAVEVIGDRWSLLVLRDVMFDNRRHFRILRGTLRSGNRLEQPRRPLRICVSVKDVHRAAVVTDSALRGPDALNGPLGDTRARRSLARAEDTCISLEMWFVEVEPGNAQAATSRSRSTATTF